MSTLIGYLKYIADRFDTGKYENRKLNLTQEIYAYVMPRQDTMLAEIPLNKEHDIVFEKLDVPKGGRTPCFIGVGDPKEEERVLEQYNRNLDSHIHMGAW